MSTKHTLKITNSEGDAIFTRVELDGVQQFVDGFDIGYRMDSSGYSRNLTVQLSYPYCGVEVEMTDVEVKRRHSVRLFIPGYEGISSNGYGETIADALRDMASRLDAGQ